MGEMECMCRITCNTDVYYAEHNDLFCSLMDAVSDKNSRQKMTRGLTLTCIMQNCDLSTII